MLRRRNNTLLDSPEDLTTLSDILNANDWRHLSIYDNRHSSVRKIRRADNCISVIIVEDGEFYIDISKKAFPVATGMDQVISFLTVKNNHAIPYVSVITDKESEESYKTIMEEVKNIVPEFPVTIAVTNYSNVLQKIIIQCVYVALRF